MNSDLKKKSIIYRIIGIILAVVGFGGVITCFILFATAGFDAFDSDGPTPRLLIPFILFIPSGIVGAIGTMFITRSKVIMLGQSYSGIVEGSFGTKCVYCGSAMSKDKLFCTTCGKELGKECPNCHSMNSNQNEYCGQCGNKL